MRKYIEYYFVNGLLEYYSGFITIAIGQTPRNDPTLKPFSQIFPELSIDADDIIYRGEQFVLLASLHDANITIAHIC